MTTAAKGGGEVKGRTAPAPGPVGQRSAAGDGLNVVSSTVVVATVSFRVATRVIKRRKCNVWCLGLCSTMFQGSHCCIFAGQARASCRKNLLPGCLSVSFACQTESSRVESTCMYQSHITTAKEHCNHPACQTKQPRPKEPAKHGVGDLWRSATGFNTVQTCTMATCHKGLPKAPCLVLAMGLRAENVGFFKQ